MQHEVILIDANALVDFFLGETSLQSAAQSLRRQHPDWLTIPWCRYEFGNAVRKYTRLGHIQEADGYEILQAGLAMIRLCPDCDGRVVLAEANRSNLTFYDAAYVARARSSGLRLRTRDGDILRNCPDVASSLAEA